LSLELFYIFIILSLKHVKSFEVCTLHVISRWTGVESSTE